MTDIHPVARRKLLARNLPGAVEHERPGLYQKYL